MAKYNQLLRIEEALDTHDLVLLKSAYMNDGNNGTEDTSDLIHVHF